MSRLPALLMILAFCLSVLAPAQAAGLLDGDSKCRHLASAAAALDAGQAAPDGAPAAPCQMACPIFATFLAVPANALGASGFASAQRLTIAKRPAGIDRPPRA